MAFLVFSVVDMKLAKMPQVNGYSAERVAYLAEREKAAHEAEARGEVFEKNRNNPFPDWIQKYIKAIGPWLYDIDNEQYKIKVADDGFDVLDARITKWYDNSKKNKRRSEFISSHQLFYSKVADAHVSDAVLANDQDFRDLSVAKNPKKKKAKKKAKGKK